MSEMVEVADRGRTHWVGCWATHGHHECAQSRIAELEAGLRTLTRMAEQYMKYHADKFYPDGYEPTGLWPCIREAAALLAGGKEPKP